MSCSRRERTHELLPVCRKGLFLATRLKGQGLSNAADGKQNFCLPLYINEMMNNFFILRRDQVSGFSLCFGMVVGLDNSLIGRLQSSL